MQRLCTVCILEQSLFWASPGNHLVQHKCEFSLCYARYSYRHTQEYTEKIGQFHSLDNYFVENDLQYVAVPTTQSLELLFK